MLKLLYALVIVLIVAASLVRPVLADGHPGSLALSVGAQFPSSSNAQSLGFHTQLGAGLDYRFPSRSEHAPLFTYFDYRGGSGSSGLHASIYSLGVGYTSESLTRAQPYAGLGIGYSSVTGSLNAGSFGTFQLTQGGVGGKVFVGTDFSPNIGLEADYNVSPSIVGVGTNSYGVRLRYRFR